ncbi:MAG: cobalamin-independent methionine synthase II family protein [Chloroflexi bacterium]|nr:cobalamin-independent methionine synthase II family protein [Chloroflexota bacterium]
MTILTTHTGSLPRPTDLSDMMLQYDAGQLQDVDVLRGRIASATAEVVKRQADIGIDVLNDGEYSKVSYSGYVKERLSGFDGEPRRRDMRDPEFPDWVRPFRPQVRYPTNNGAVNLRDPSAVRRDIDNLRTALEGVRRADVFMSAASPGVIDTFMPSTYYPSDEDYLRAVGQAMRDEYRAIVDAGFVLQLDCPDLAMSRQMRFGDLSDQGFLSVAQMHVSVLNEAIDGLPRDRVRLHLCWGNFAGPHVHDVPLASILEIACSANVGGLSFEAANPRHAHEWKVFRSVGVPSDLVLIPGVIDSCTTYVEHPELVAERLQHFVDIVGEDRVMASTDCGFGTSVGPRDVSPSIAWAKLQAMVEGARLASRSPIAV